MCKLHSQFWLVEWCIFDSFFPQLLFVTLVRLLNELHILFRVFLAVLALILQIELNLLWWWRISSHYCAVTSKSHRPFKQRFRCLDKHGIFAKSQSFQSNFIKQLKNEPIVWSLALKVYHNINCFDFQNFGKNSLTMPPEAKFYTRGLLLTHLLKTWKYLVRSW